MSQIGTYFARAERADAPRLKADIERLSHNPVIDSLMDTVGGCLAVLNEQRQILVLNEALLKLMGIEDPGEVLGLRPGEALDCIHAHDHPGGCGTSRSCRTCGAAISMVACLTENEPQEEVCVATVRRNHAEVDLYFRVRCCPITLYQQRFLLLFLQDVTVQQQQSVLERVFFHDVQNTIAALKLNCQLLEQQSGPESGEAFIARIKQLSETLAHEIEIQRILSNRGSHSYRVSSQSVRLADILNNLKVMFTTHPVAQNKTLRVVNNTPELTIHTDPMLLQRILVNMLANAFEATDADGEVQVWLDINQADVVFNVWNNKAIAEDIVPRIFQRNFSTKEESGRGLGTYSMKLFAETYLKGKVSFTTSQAKGTVFRLQLPRS